MLGMIIQLRRRLLTVALQLILVPSLGGFLTGCASRGPEPETSVRTRAEGPRRVGPSGAVEPSVADSPTGSWGEVARAPATVPGFRVQIFATTSPENALIIADQARQKGLAPVYVEQGGPFQKVRIGDCLTLSEAELLLGRVVGIGYRDAMVVETAVRTEQ